MPTEEEMRRLLALRAEQTEKEAKAAAESKMVQGSQLSDQDFDLVAKWLEDCTPGGLVCPVCKSKRWSISMGVVSHLYYPPPPILRPGTEIFLTIFVVCRKCANVLFFEPSLMGLPVTKGVVQEKRVPPSPEEKPNG